MSRLSPPLQAPQVRLLITITLREGLELLHCDAERLFVQSKLNGELYMRLPPRCKEASGRVIELARSIHGLYQAGRCWHSLLEPQLDGFVLVRCPTDRCVFRATGKDGRIRMLPVMHANDCILEVGGPDCDHLHTQQNKRFPKNLEDLTNYTVPLLNAIEIVTALPFPRKRTLIEY